MSEQIKVESVPSVLDNQMIKDFIQDREIRPEDLPLIVELAAFSKRSIIECLHNAFNLGRETSGQNLAAAIQSSRSDEYRRLYTAAKRFFDKYDWIVCGNLVRILERI